MFEFINDLTNFLNMIATQELKIIIIHFPFTFDIYHTNVSNSCLISSYGMILNNM